MPNVTIYVKEKDLALISQATELTGRSLSSLVAEALARFIENYKPESGKGLAERVAELEQKVSLMSQTVYR